MKGRFADDLTGKIFGNILVRKRAPNYYEPSDTEKKHPKARWTCECLLCGTIKDIRASHLKSGKVISCGCEGRRKAKESKIKHNKRHTKLYGVWNNIKSRCYNPDVPCYKNYGARGIYVCDEWKNNFEEFYEWCYKNGYDDNADFMQCQIDRIDNNGPYSPDNCRFVTAKINANNRRSSKPKDPTVYTVLSISTTINEWQKIINTYSYKIRIRAKDLDIPIEMFILYAIERNAKIIKIVSSRKKYNKENFIKIITDNIKQYNLDKMDENALKDFIMINLKHRKTKDVAA